MAWYCFVCRELHSNGYICREDANVKRVRELKEEVEARKHLIRNTESAKFELEVLVILEKVLVDFERLLSIEDKWNRVVRAWVDFNRNEWNPNALLMVGDILDAAIAEPIIPHFIVRP